nr:MAG TPA: hypothetical protein [Caudoviricetes sp.]
MIQIYAPLFLINLFSVMICYSSLLPKRRKKVLRNI